LEPKQFSVTNGDDLELSRKVCAVCGKELLQSEIRINEMGRKTSLKKIRYLCTSCRRREYEQYIKAVKELIKKP